MVVTAGTRHGQSQDGAGQCLDALFPLLGHHLADHGRIELQLLPVGGTESEEPQGGPVAWLRAGEQVRCQLHPHEAVIGHVVVERPNHPVPIAPGLPLALEPGLSHVAVADQIEPEPAPAFAVGRCGEQAVDQARRGIRGRVPDEGVDLLRRRRQAGQVERYPPNEGSPRGCGGRCQLMPVQFREDECVDALPRPFRVPDRRRIDGLRRLKRPEFASLCQVDAARLDGNVGNGIREDSAVPDPRFQDRYLFRSQFLGRRHLQVLGLVAHGLDEEALVELARNDGRAAVAALEDSGPAIEQQAALVFLGLAGVALVTLLDQERADLLLEEVPLFRRAGRRGRWFRG